ncbi:PREDICTED: neuroblast differentiation-associated protein AHNAK-like, partial [Cariama cristata]|uniref:neuroblast differentiation-associated protein AHNAK-like n=1 Tax=Cariama cristata TaxID=54380 RepID=UPI00052005F9
GDQIVGATVYFDNLQSGEVAQLLNSMGHHTVGLRLQRKGDRSPLPGQSWSHDAFAATIPEVDVDVGKGKVKIPHMTFPKFTALGSQGEGPVAEMAFPKGEVGLATPEVDVGLPDVAVKGEWKGPKFKKVETPQISLSDVNLNLKGPQVKGDVGVTVPRAEWDVKGLGPKGLKMDAKAPDGEFESPERSLKGPGASAPDTDVHAKGPKLKGEVDVSIPKTGGTLKGPQLDVEGPKLGMAAPGVDVKGPK